MYVMYTAEDKAQAIKMRDAGKTVSVISKELNIAESTLYRWFCIYATAQSINEELMCEKYSHKNLVQRKFKTGAANLGGSVILLLSK